MIETVACPTCRRPLRVPDALLGQQVMCPACEQTFTAHEDLEPVPPPGLGRSRPMEELEEVADRPTQRSNRSDRDRDEEDDDRRDRRRRRRVGTPGKATAVAVMTLVGGILAVMISLLKVPFCFFLIWPGTYFGLVSGILCIIKGTRLLGSQGRFEGPPTATAILQIINVINLDLFNLTLGILNLVFINDLELRSYYRRRESSERWKVEG